MKNLAIAITGMPGSGKSYVSKILSEKLKIKVFSMGDVVREEAKSRGLSLTVENIENLASELRKQYGNNAVAKILMEKLEKNKYNMIIIDGVRGLEELKIFNTIYDICLIAVHASPLTRFKRLNERKREGNDISWDEFTFRDKKNLEYGIGNVIALSDFIVINESNLKDVESQINDIVEVIKNGEWKNYCRGGIETY
ncbi:dephospho-CoA kinase [Caldisphaera lagunensis DSM 15908]|uniref:Dephospho-CoA kinase n=1 Tax=Caldisphaera lagunensis (strain DSM 15908 / JCM 11604 / ANMR 0165 / IC-154) TaxID=1056495 RepID=L0ABC8_CALLD|nr:AAA family ATPase [Caldisphaera lagunensis]AFZ71161.1 dephospho-CoA kinase [Caldisphaera lagunensis DSM 15908]